MSISKFPFIEKRKKRKEEIVVKLTYDDLLTFYYDANKWRRDFEASQRKELINLRHNDKRDIAIRRALIFYIESKVLGIKRNTLGKEIVGCK